MTILLCGFYANAQEVTTVPSPLQEDSENVELYFHADQGGKGLMGQPSTAALYAYTGVSIKDASGKVSQWQYVIQSKWEENVDKCRLQYVSPNLWKLSIGDLHTFYGVPADKQICEICLVFRNATGSTKNGDDVFVPVSEQGFQIAFTSNVQPGVVSTSSSVSLTMSSTQNASLAIAVNGTPINTTAGARTLTASYTFPATGDYLFTATANNGTETKTETLAFCVADNSKPASLTQAPPMGAFRNADGSVTFTLAAPQKTNVMLVGSWNSYKYTNSQMMEYIDQNVSGTNCRFFTITLPESTLPRDKQFIYFYLVDGKTKVCDPYARLALDPWNDKYIGEDLFPGMPDYPADYVSGTPVAWFDDHYADYSWQTGNFELPSKTDLVIYELLLRDFTGTEGKAYGDGTVRKAIAKIPYLKSLGINAVELLPINEFSGNISWGYNPNLYFAIDKAYGTPQDYKEFIDKCHAEGIAVILDMVFNQSDGLHPWYMMYTPDQNPFYNLNAPHAYSVLNDWNQGYPLVQQQWKDCLQYWLKEYNVDGFRFDLVKGLGDNSSYANSGDSGTNAYNASRIARMKQLHAWIKEIKPDAYFINENLAGAAEENAMAEDGELNWANVNDAGCQFAMGYQSNSNLNRMWAVKDSRTAGSTVAYLESHDEERLAYKQNTWGVAEVKGNIKASCHRLGSAAAQMILVPGSHMIWQFSEMGNAQSTKSNGNNNTDPKIVDWVTINEPNHGGLVQSYRELIDLRLKNTDLFDASAAFNNMCDATNWADGRTITATTADKELYCAINPNTSGTISVTIPFRSGDDSAYKIWSQSYNCQGSFSAAGKTITVPANCYVVVGTRNVSEVKGIESDAPEFRVSACRGMIALSGLTAAADIYDTAGKKVAATTETDFSVALPAGLYIVKSGRHALKVLVK